MAAALLLLVATVAAQTNASNWNAVKALTAGTDVRIKTGSRTVSGKLERVTDETIVVNSGKGSGMFTQQEVTRVSVKRNSHRGRNSLIGFGVGTGAGLGIGAAKAAGCNDIACGPVNTALGGVIGAVGGTIAGAVASGSDWREIYKK